MDLKEIRKRIAKLAGPGVANNLVPEESIQDYQDYIAANPEDEVESFPNKQGQTFEQTVFPPLEPSNSFLNFHEKKALEPKLHEQPYPFPKPDNVIPNEPLQEYTPNVPNVLKTEGGIPFYLANPGNTEKVPNKENINEQIRDFEQYLFNLGKDAANPFKDQPPSPLALPTDPKRELASIDSQDSLSGSFGSVQEQPEKSELDVGTNNIASLENMLAALEGANAVRTGADLSRSADILSSGIASLGAGTPIKPTGQELFKDQAKGAEQITDDYKQMVEMQKHDPNSPLSKAFRQFAEKLGVSIKGDLTAAEGEKIIPYIYKEFEAKENRKARKDELAMRLQEMRMRREELKAQKEAITAERKEQKMHDWISSKNDKLTNSKEYQNYLKMRRAKENIRDILNNPNSVGDVSALYTFITSLDPESTVREGEIQLGQKALGIFGKLSTQITQLSKNPRLLTNKFLREIEHRVNKSLELAEKDYKDRRNVAFEEAKARGIDESRFGEIDPVWLLEKNNRNLNENKPSEEDKLFDSLK